MIILINDVYITKCVIKTKIYFENNKIWESPLIPCQIKKTYQSLTMFFVHDIIYLKSINKQIISVRECFERVKAKENLRQLNLQICVQ